MTIKDIYILAHAEAVKLEVNLGPVALVTAKLAAWEAAKATPGNALTDADFPAFEAHLEESYRRLVRLDKIPADSTVLANQNAEKVARLAKLQELQAKQAGTAPAPATPVTVPASSTPAPSPAETTEPKAE